MSKQNTLEQKKARRLEKHLAAYSIAAGAVLAAAGNATAGIIYTDVNPDAVLNTDGATFEIDFGGLSSNQFRITLVLGATYNDYKTNVLKLYKQSEDASWRTMSFRPMALNYNQQVNTGTAKWLNTLGTMAYLRTNPMAVTRLSGGYFWNTTDKYLGLKFKIGTNTHYGWAHVMAPGADVVLAVITGYAYNDTPDGNIAAGDIPEAGSLALLALGAAGLTAWRKKRS